MCGFAGFRKESYQGGLPFDWAGCLTKPDRVDESEKGLIGGVGKIGKQFHSYLVPARCRSSINFS